MVSQEPSSDIEPSSAQLGVNQANPRGLSNITVRALELRPKSLRSVLPAFLLQICPAQMHEGRSALLAPGKLLHEYVAARLGSFPRPASLPASHRN